jgi:L-rhamnose isomerase
MKDKDVELVWKALDKLNVELPSWGFANTGTRFGKFIQPAAATTIEEKFSDAAQVHAVTGACPTLALHVQWDMPNGLQDVPKIEKLAAQFFIRPGSINPNIFQNQEYKFGSVGNPDTSSIACRSPKLCVPPTFRRGSRMARTIPAPRTFASASVTSKKAFGKFTQP